MGLQVVVSPYNSLDGDRYFDVESATSFAFDHTTQVRDYLAPFTSGNYMLMGGLQKASQVQSYVLESQNGDLM